MKTTRQAALLTGVFLCGASMPAAQPANDNFADRSQLTGTAQGSNTIVGVEAAHFTLNHRPTFLLGFSYFLMDLRGASRGGAAGWCFHNGGQRTQPDGQPRRCFDLRAKPLMDQLDDEETKVVRSVSAVRLDPPK